MLKPVVDHLMQRIDARSNRQLHSKWRLNAKHSTRNNLSGAQLTQPKMACKLLRLMPGSADRQSGTRHHQLTQLLLLLL
jgi:hypothetical protein